MFIWNSWSVTDTSANLVFIWMSLLKERSYDLWCRTASFRCLHEKIQRAFKHCHIYAPVKISLIWLPDGACILIVREIYCHRFLTDRKQKHVREYEKGKDRDVYRICVKNQVCRSFWSEIEKCIQRMTEEDIKVSECELIIY